MAKNLNCCHKTINKQKTLFRDLGFIRLNNFHSQESEMHSLGDIRENGQI